MGESEGDVIKCVTCGVYDAGVNGQCVKCNAVAFTSTELSFWRVVKYIEQEHPALFDVLDIPRLYSDVVLPNADRTEQPPANGKGGA